MSNKLAAYCLGIVGAWVCVTPSIGRAQSEAGANLYGQGVNAFFAGQSGLAESYLSRAMAIQPHDPRPYYFRSLSLLRQGRIGEARSDMQTGAELEARLPNRYAIGMELQRVQGTARLMLEEYRRNARATAATTTSSVNNPQFRERDPAVLRDRRVIPLDELLRPGGPRSVAFESIPMQPSTSSQAVKPAGSAAPTQAAGTPPVPPQTAPTQPATSAATAKPLPTPPQTAEEDPFQDDAMSAAPPAEPAAAQPAEEAPPADSPANPPANAEEDPFSGLWIDRHERTMS